MNRSRSLTGIEQHLLRADAVQELIVQAVRCQKVDFDAQPVFQREAQTGQGKQAAYLAFVYSQIDAARPLWRRSRTGRRVPRRSAFPAPPQRSVFRLYPAWQPFVCLLILVLYFDNTTPDMRLQGWYQSIADEFIYLPLPYPLVDLRRRMPDRRKNKPDPRISPGPGSDI